MDGTHADHVAWVRGLSDAQVDAGRAWLGGIVERVEQMAGAE